jgi:chemotaxis protein CheX
MSQESFQIDAAEKYVQIKLTGRPTVDSAKTFEQEIPKLLNGTPKPVVLLCGELQELSPHWIRHLAMFSQQLKAAKTELRLVGVSPEILQLIRQNGLNQILPTKPTLQSALVDMGLAQPVKMDMKFINPFLVATIRVLEVQAQVKASPGKPFKRSAKDSYSGDISGVIGLVSDAFTGAVVLSFPQATFLNIMTNMLGEPCKELTQDLADGAGELMNIIFGQAKIALNDQGFGIKTAIPTVIKGENHSIQTQTTGPRVALPFESNAGPFVVEICLSE